MNINTSIISYAIQAHAETNHLYDGKPYTVHLALTSYYALKYIDLIPGQCHEDVYSACWLHDTIEDTRNTYNDILKISNVNVADIVYAVTNEKGKSRKERANDKYYHGIRLTPFAAFVKLCDRLANAKYSKDNNSSMLKVYRKENAHFIDSIFSFSGDVIHYESMINELNEILNN